MQPLEVSSNIAWYETDILHLLYLLIGGVAYSNAHFGAGTGPIYLDDVVCTSSANQLLECSSRPILSHSCRHSEDAGVGCKGKYLFWLNFASKFCCLSYMYHMWLHSSMHSWSTATGRR